MELYLTSYTKINSKWIKDKCKTWNCKTFTRKHREKASDIGLGNDFSDVMPKAQAAKAKINRCEYIKLQSFYIANSQQDEKSTYRMGENIDKPYIW